MTKIEALLRIYKMLGIKATTPLEESLEVIGDYIEEMQDEVEFLRGVKQ